MQGLSLIHVAAPDFYNESSVVYGDLVPLSLIFESDGNEAVIILLCYVNGTGLSFEGYNINPGVAFAGPPAPSSSFPYGRLAGFSNNDSSGISIYHQVNAMTFTNDNWDSSTGIWTSENITVDVT